MYWVIWFGFRRVGLDSVRALFVLLGIFDEKEFVYSRSRLYPVGCIESHKLWCDLVSSPTYKTLALVASLI